MGIDKRYPDTHADFIERCHKAGQTRPTPLLLQYGVDGYNCLHQDLYGEHVFPIQLAILPSQPNTDLRAVSSEPGTLSVVFNLPSPRAGPHLVTKNTS